MFKDIKKGPFIVKSVIVFVVFLLFFSYFWMTNNFGNVSVDQLIFHMRTPSEGVDTSFVFSFILKVLPKAVIITVVFQLIYCFCHKYSINFVLKKKENKVFHLRLSSLAYVCVICTILFIGCSVNNELKVGTYFKNQVNSTDIYDKYYTETDYSLISFPENKRNLIYIFLESMETTYMSKDVGGAFDYNLIPNLTRIAQDNTSFSNTEKLEGAYMVSGTTWTTAAMVSHTSGVPLKLPFFDGDENKIYSDAFMPKIITLGDILAKNGYKQEVMFGSNASYAGKKDYFLQHKNYTVWDYETAKAEKKIPEDYHVWWGFEDQKLYNFAKEEITKLSNCGQPFNFTMITVDTHHISGYVCPLCENKYDKQYSNVISCADNQIEKFIEWLMEQDFYENTTIVLVGDHTSMDPHYFKDVPSSYRRAPYNVFINSAVEVENMKNRKFCSMDFYPTTLAAIGANIDGDRLGLGTNLFSSKKTLLEELGLEKYSSELEKKSDYYNKKIAYGE